MQTRASLRNELPMPVLAERQQQAQNRSLVKLDPRKNLASLNSLSVSDVPSYLPPGKEGQSKNLKGNYHSSRQVARGNSSHAVRVPFHQDPLNKFVGGDSNYQKSI